jgi:hypothetical protein
VFVEFDFNHQLHVQHVINDVLAILPGYQVQYKQMDF